LLSIFLALFASLVFWCEDEGPGSIGKAYRNLLPGGGRQEENWVKGELGSLFGTAVYL